MLSAAEQEDSFLMISVTDEGEGIEAAETSRIFERFYRVDKSRSKSSGGAGLGLAIAKSIVQLHGGEIGVRSSAGAGSCFWFTLPIYTSRQTSADQLHLHPVRRSYNTRWCLNWQAIIYSSSAYLPQGCYRFLAPCILPLLPVYIAYLSGTGANGTNTEKTDSGSIRLRPVLIVRTLLFVLGLSTVFVLLGFGSGTIGTVITSSRFIAVCGAVVVLFGLYQTGWINLSWLERDRKISSDRIDKGGYIGAFLLGLTFSFGWTPCIGPVLAAILSIAAGEGSPAYGGFLMLIYTLGLAIPFLLMSVFSDFILARLRRLYKFMGMIKIISGCILMLMGIVLMTDRLNTIIVWFQ